MSIHQRIKERRLALKMSHTVLGNAVGVAWQTVQAWEREEGTAPNRSRIGKVAEVLGVSVKWLLAGTDDPSDEANDPALPAKQVPAEYAWISAEEARLLTLYRTTNARGRAQIMNEAEEMPKVVLPGIVRNEA